MIMEPDFALIAEAISVDFSTVRTVIQTQLFFSGFVLFHFSAEVTFQ